MSITHTMHTFVKFHDHCSQSVLRPNVACHPTKCGKTLTQRCHNLVDPTLPLTNTEIRQLHKTTETWVVGTVVAEATITHGALKKQEVANKKLQRRRTLGKQICLYFICFLTVEEIPVQVRVLE